MSDDERSARAYQVVSGESTPPDEHTARVRAERERDKAAPSQLKVHDSAQGDSPSEPASPRSSTELAESSRRARRRERDRRAERRAVQILVAGFVGLGGAALLALNLLWDDPPPELAPPPPAGAVVPPPKPKVPGQRSTFSEGADIPAIHSMKSEGLTIAAEGLPEVLAEQDDGSQANLAALETCRYAYGVWEFSPNKRFRFLTTCEALEGQILVGAYEVQGSKVLMSPLQSVEAQLISEFEVEKPSMMRTQIVTPNGKNLLVNQRVTVMRPGLDGEPFQNTYAPKNTVQIPGQRRGGESPPPAKGSLSDLLKGGAQ